MTDRPGFVALLSRLALGVSCLLVAAPPVAASPISVEWAVTFTNLGLPPVAGLPISGRLTYDDSVNLNGPGVEPAYWITDIDVNIGTWRFGMEDALYRPRYTPPPANFCCIDYQISLAALTARGTGLERAGFFEGGFFFFYQPIGEPFFTFEEYSPSLLVTAPAPPAVPESRSIVLIVLGLLMAMACGVRPARRLPVAAAKDR